MIAVKTDQQQVAKVKISVCSFIRRIGANRDGATMVEFAFVAPILILLLAGSIELGMVFSTSALMEGALRDASRYGVTGQEPNESARLERILEIVGERTLGLVDMSKARIEVLVYAKFGDIGKPESFVDANGNGVYDSGESFTDTNGNGVRNADSGVPGPGGSGDIVVYRIHYDWPLLTPVLGPIIGGDKTLPLTASLAVRNEPWDEL